MKFIRLTLRNSWYIAFTERWKRLWLLLPSSHVFGLLFIPVAFTPVQTEFGGFVCAVFEQRDALPSLGSFGVYGGSGWRESPRLFQVGERPVPRSSTWKRPTRCDQRWLVFLATVEPPIQDASLGFREGGGERPSGGLAWWPIWLCKGLFTQNFGVRYPISKECSQL